MMRILQNQQAYLLFVLISFACGCVAFRGDNLPSVPSWPLDSSSPKKAISLTIDKKGWINGKENETKPEQLERIKAPCVKAFQESGLFSEVRSPDQASDLVVLINVEERTEYNQTLDVILTVTFGLASFLIPQKYTGNFLIKTVVKDRDGHEIASFERSESLSLWVQFFLVFVAPFRDTPAEVMHQALYDLNRAIIHEAHNKGVL